MSDKFKLGLTVLLVVLSMVIVPLMIIVSVNVLFAMSIPLTWQTWLSMVVLINAIRWTVRPKAEK